jgi:diguanylate cyclase (GGDEF)-like protein
MSVERIQRVPKEARAPSRPGRGAAVALPNAQLFGIPEDEFTARVRKALLNLTVEADVLKRELAEMRAKLEETERAADLDHLLPTLNRRAFVRELARHIGVVARYATPACLVYFDLDGFKLVNDNFGHAAGDAVLAHFASTLQAHVRDTDVVGRLGGDEFAVILSHANESQARMKAERLADHLSDEPAIWRGRPLAIGFSHGVLELEASDKAETALARADEAMYRQKRGGR